MYFDEPNEVTVTFPNSNGSNNNSTRNDGSTTWTESDTLEHLIPRKRLNSKAQASSEVEPSTSSTSSQHYQNLSTSSSQSPDQTYTTKTIQNLPNVSSSFDKQAKTFIVDSSLLQETTNITRQQQQQQHNDIQETHKNGHLEFNPSLVVDGNNRNANPTIRIQSGNQAEANSSSTLPKLVFSPEISSPSSSSSDNFNSKTKVEFVLGTSANNSGNSNNSDMHNMLRAMKKRNGNKGLKTTPNSAEEKLLSNMVNNNYYDLNGGGGKAVVGNSNDVNHNHNNNSHCSSLLSAEENFECLADGTESFFDSPIENTSLQYLRDANDLSPLDSASAAGPSNTSGNTSASGFRRNTLLRTSLRKSPQNSSSSSNNNGDMGHRRWGSFRNTSGTKRPLGTSTPTSSNALATQLYRTSSFNSTGRSSAGDAEEMYSDGSLEDEVIDLTQKVHHLEEKFTVLAENQSDVDDRYTRAKQENSELSTKLFLLEEQLRDVEQRSEEKLRDEQKRCKDALTRLDREKHLQIENYDIRLASLDKELAQSRSESVRQKQQLDRERTERIQQCDKLIETERELNSLRDDNRSLMEQARRERESLVSETNGSQQALQELRKEFEHLRRFQMEKISNGSLLNHRESLDGDSNEIRSRLVELEEENKQLKQRNKRLEETNEDLTAQILNHGLEEGRHLLTLSPRDLGNSLAAELEAMSQDQMKSALKEQKEVNDQLRNYIDGILLTIVENYPQLLEVKHKSNSHPADKQNVRRES